MEKSAAIQCYPLIAIFYMLVIGKSFLIKSLTLKQLCLFSEIKQLLVLGQSDGISVYRKSSS